MRGVILHFSPDSGELDCPDNGEMVLTRGATENAGETTVVARSVGPIAYRAEKLTLEQRVVVTFQEDGVERRALWCDTATVLFREDDGGDGASGGTSMAGLDKLIAVGRVHIEQSEPRPLIGEGQTLEWWVEGDDQVMLLKGLRPARVDRGAVERPRHAV